MQKNPPKKKQQLICDLVKFIKVFSKKKRKKLSDLAAF